MIKTSGIITNEKNTFKSLIPISVLTFTILTLAAVSIFIQPAYTDNISDSRAQVEHEFGLYAISNALNIQSSSDGWSRSSLTPEGLARVIQKNIPNSSLSDNIITVEYNNITFECFGNGLNGLGFSGYVIIDINGQNLPNSLYSDTPDQFKHNLVLKDGIMTVQ